MHATCVSAWWPQPITPSVRAPALREVPRRDAARRAGTQLAEPVGLDHRDERRRLRVEEADDEGRAVRRRRVQLPAGEPEPVSDAAMSASAPSGRRSRRRGAISTSPAAIRRKHASMASTASAGDDERRDVGLGEIERHEPQV